MTTIAVSTDSKVSAFTPDNQNTWHIREIRSCSLYDNNFIKRSHLTDRKGEAKAHSRWCAGRSQDVLIISNLRAWRCVWGGWEIKTEKAWTRFMLMSVSFFRGVECSRATNSSNSNGHGKWGRGVQAKRGLLKWSAVTKLALPVMLVHRWATTVS